MGAKRTWSKVLMWVLREHGVSAHVGAKRTWSKVLMWVLREHGVRCSCGCFENMKCCVLSKHARVSREYAYCILNHKNAQSGCTVTYRISMLRSFT